MGRQQKKYLQGRSVREKVGITLTVQADPNLLIGFPADVARDFAVIPISYSGKCLILATEGCLRPEQLSEISQRLGVLVQVIRCRISGFNLLLEDLFNKTQCDRKSEEGRNSEDKKTESRTLPKLLVNLGLLHSEELPGHLEQQLRDQNLFLAWSALLDRRVRSLVPESIARHHKVLPLGRIENGLLIATDRELEPSTLRDIQALTKLNPRPLIFDLHELVAAIDKFYRTRRQANTRRDLSDRTDLEDFDRQPATGRLVAGA